MTKVVELEKDKDGVYKPVGEAETKDESLDEKQEKVKTYVKNNYSNSQAEQILSGFELGMSVIRRFAKAVEKF